MNLINERWNVFIFSNLEYLFPRLIKTSFDVRQLIYHMPFLWYVSLWTSNFMVFIKRGKLVSLFQKSFFGLQMTVSTILHLMAERSHVQCHEKWGLVEYLPELNIERFVKQVINFPLQKVRSREKVIRKFENPINVLILEKK